MSVHSKTKGEGFPVVFIHGFCETSEIWSPFLDHLAKGIHAIAIDLPGFGHSPLPSELNSLDEIGKYLNNWINGLQLKKKPIIVGHSLGGYMGCAMLRQNPDLYSGLALFHSTAAADSTEKKANRDKVMSFVRENGVKTFLDSFVPSLFHQKDKGNMDFVLKIAQKTTENTFLTYTQAMRDRLESESLLQSLKVPVLILAGSQDALIPLESLQNQSKLNTSIELQVLEEVGHMGMLEAKLASANVINAFIERVKASSAH